MEEIRREEDMKCNKGCKSEFFFQAFLFLFNSSTFFFFFTELTSHQSIHLNISFSLCRKPRPSSGSGL